jgi:hypothetical protein
MGEVLFPLYAGLGGREPGDGADCWWRVKGLIEKSAARLGPRLPACKRLR